MADRDSARELDVVVPTVVGDLGAILRLPQASGTLPGVVLVDGSGDGDRLDWGGWPDWIGDAGAVVLRHDKPGCGGSPGDWTQQTLEDRARETLAAVEVLRRDPSVAGQPVGLYGISQGGWVALIAAALSTDVDFVICHSGPGTTPAAQERDRIEKSLRAADLDESAIAEGMAWVDERADRIRRGDSPEVLLAAQEAFADRPWYPGVSFAYDDPAFLGFVGRILDFDPTSVMPQVLCPVLALFGGADPLVPVQSSLEAFARYLPPAPHGHGFAVFPGANHGLFVADPDPTVDRRDQLAPAYLPTLTAFLAERRRERSPEPVAG